jgi:hypothetical protein
LNISVVPSSIERRKGYKSRRRGSGRGSGRGRGRVEGREWKKEKDEKLAFDKSIKIRSGELPVCIPRGRRIEIW